MVDSALRYIQAAIETTPGTYLAATRKLPVEQFSFELMPSYDTVQEFRGDYAQARRLAPGGKICRWSLTANLEQNDLAFWMQGIFGTISPVTVVTTGRQWNGHDILTTAKKSYAAEISDGRRVHQLTYMCPDSLRIEFNADRKATYTIGGFAQALAVTGSMTSLSQNTTALLMSWSKRFYLDAAGAVPGTTALDATLLSGSWSMSNGARYLYVTGGSQNFGLITYSNFTSTMDMVLVDKSGLTVWDNMATPTQRVAAVELRGALISGAVYQGVYMITCGNFRQMQHTAVEGANSFNASMIPVVDSAAAYGGQTGFSSMLSTINLINAY